MDGDSDAKISTGMFCRMNDCDEESDEWAILSPYSGTLSYIFNNFKGTHSFSDVMAEAKEVGFTKPDPRDNLSGTDLVRKVDVKEKKLEPDRRRQPLAAMISLVVDALSLTSASLLDHLASASKPIDGFVLLHHPYTQMNPGETESLGSVSLCSGRCTEDQVIILARESCLKVELFDIQIANLVPKPLRDITSTEEFMHQLPNFNVDLSKRRDEAEAA